MFFKATFYSNLLFVTFLLYLGIGCAASNQNRNANLTHSDRPLLTSGFALPGQQVPPKDIQSIHVHPQNAPAKAPIISLKTSQKLVLSFDYLSTQSRQFRIEISHRTQNWKQSSITASTYLDSFSYAFIQNAKASFTNNPSYRHVEYSFPNDQLRPAVSGNYLIEVYDDNDGTLLFKLPFFVTENEGQISTQIDRLFAKRNDGRPLDQPSSKYQYPKFVEYPQFDLSMSFAQNQFWGRMRKADFLDTITQNKLNGRLQINNSFVGNYEFKTLNLQNFEADGQQIVEYFPGLTPPKVVLRRDIQRFGVTPSPFPLSNLGMPSKGRSGNYARVQFSLTTDSSVSPNTNIFVIGDFNNWIVNDFHQMEYDSERKLWKGNAIIKEGQYAYKYVTVSNNNINDLALDQLFVSSAQEYFTFIYYKDPDKNFDRLLKVDRTMKQ
ncbi:protein of unknown function (DUF5103) [Fodinibius salinus]|uniref:Type 9 secretion system plug protein N-terminal domain-containing protein n=1 Tax=Fodinibius salinus TaxID=860790 RepID=A0A5D3YME8_9BACT|nr:type IX secretion system plug protein domain-containing protein [Fodinibius salinus]TYP94932.1 protein of unknown function (DUF5103) [Fodinibius salinus]